LGPSRLTGINWNNYRIRLEQAEEHTPPTGTIRFTHRHRVGGEASAVFPRPAIPRKIQLPASEGATRGRIDQGDLVRSGADGAAPSM
jgi:hypothetical protein